MRCKGSGAQGECKGNNVAEHDTKMNEGNARMHTCKSGSLEHLLSFTTDLRDLVAAATDLRVSRYS